MTEHINDPIAALRTELASVAPSPGFAERVRERLSDDLSACQSPSDLEKNQIQQLRRNPRRGSLRPSFRYVFAVALNLSLSRCHFQSLSSAVSDEIYSAP